MIVLKPPWPATCIILWYQLTWNWRWPQPTSLAKEFPLWSQIWQPYLSGWLSSLVRLSRRLTTKSPLAPTNPLWAFWTYFLVGYFSSLQLLKLKKKRILQSFLFSFLSLQNLFWIALCQMLQASNTLEVPMSLCYRPKHRKGTVFQRTVLELAPYVWMAD